MVVVLLLVEVVLDCEVVLDLVRLVAEVVIEDDVRVVVAVVLDVMLEVVVDDPDVDDVVLVVFVDVVMVVGGQPFPSIAQHISFFLSDQHTSQHW